MLIGLIKDESGRFDGYKNMINTTKNGRISAVVPLYGQFSIERAIVSVKSVLSQDISDLEVIISEQGEEKRFPNIDNDILHIFNHHKPKQGLSDFNPGVVRNIGVINSIGEFVYTNDADIVFTDTRYLSRAKDILEANQGRVLFRPKMRRLPSFE